MTSSKNHVTLVTILVFLKDLVQNHIHAKFHTLGLTCSGFMIRGPLANLSPPAPGLFNVKKTPTWLGLNYHSVCWTVALVLLAEVNVIKQLQSIFSFCRSFNKYSSNLWIWRQRSVSLLPDCTDVSRGVLLPVNPVWDPNFLPQINEKLKILK